jgi:ELWxxDGT repeat protein
VGSSPNQLVAVGNRVFFTAQLVGQREIWSSDGTAIGTVPVTATAFGRLTPYTDLVATQAGLFFLHDDLTGAGTELWLTDGTTIGTRLVADVAPGLANGPLAGTVTAALGGTQVLFGAVDLANGLQLWLSDGTAANTRKVSNFGGGGVGAVSLSQFFSLGSKTYFACDDGINGIEQWVYDPSGAGVAFVLPYGLGCAGSNGVPGNGAAGLPTLGNAAFANTIAQGLPNSAAVQFWSGGSSNIALGLCRALLDFPIGSGATVFLDGAGAGSAAVPIPAVPTLVGSNLFFQWAVLDPAGPFLGLALSGGLQIQIGS